MPLRSTLSFALLLLLATPACSQPDPKAATKVNFRRVINSGLAERTLCLANPTRIGDPAIRFPVVVSSEDEGLFGERWRKRMKALLQVGVVTKRDTLIESSRYDYRMERPGESREPARVPGAKYVLTSEVRPENGSRRLCYGHKEVSEILRFTEPADMFGRRMTEVTYKTEVVGQPEWAKDKRVREVFTDLAAATSDREERITLVLTSEGWIWPEGL